MSATRGGKRAVVTWDIKLGAEDLLDLGPALEEGQWEEVLEKSRNPTTWSPFWSLFLHSPYVLLDIETFHFLLGYPSK